MNRRAIVVVILSAVIGIYLIASTIFVHDRPVADFASVPPVAVMVADADLNAPPPDPGTRLAGPDWQRWFFADWHEPYGAVLPAELQRQIWAEIERLPEEEPGRDVNSWRLVGPSGMVTPGGGLYSGRVLDLDALSASNLVVGAASGGLWRYNLIFPVPLTDDVTSQWIGSVAVHPDDDNTMLIGTGEFWIHNGTGLWKTTDGGQTWQHKTMNPEPVAFFRVRYGSDPNMVHAATRNGYYRSTDGGETWTRIQFSGAVSDIAVVPGDPDVLYLTRRGEGLYVSLDEGLQWFQAANATIPTSDVTRGAFTYCAGDPGVMYVAFTHLPGDYHVMRGIWKTTNYGYTWTDVSPPENYMGRQGWYNNVIAVSPTDPDLVFAGGVRLLRSENGGASWEIISDPHLHVDYHAMQWHPDGIRFWVGHDGGWSYSNNRGLPGSWFSAANVLPITQFVEIDAKGISWSSAYVAGGSQDNGISITTDGGQSWDHRVSADGGGIEFGLFSLNDVYFAAGVHNDGLTFHQYYSSDNCQNFIDISGGLQDSGTWYPSIRMDGAGTMYTFSGARVYSRSQSDLTWQPESAANFGNGVAELTVSPVAGAPVLYACLASENSWRMYVKDLEWWYERSAGLPEGVRVRKVVPHPTSSWRAYAIMNGLGTPGEKIFFTHNRGETWTNITGNLPNMPLADLIIFPDNDDHLVVAGEYGCYRSYDHGEHWVRWNNGIPRAVVVTELKTVDMRTFWQGYHVVAGTYGRSIWRRDISGEDPLAAGETAPAAVLTAALEAAPNPFNPVTTLSFELGKQAPVRLEVFDLSGKHLRLLVDRTLPAGEQKVDWDGRDAGGRRLASGVYLVRLQAGETGVTTKVVLAK